MGYRFLKTSTKTFNILCNANAVANAVVTAIALPVLSYMRAKMYMVVKLSAASYGVRHFVERHFV